ncbi:MAG: hypothetical protein ABEK84_01765 [Salinibacter sp.]
MLVEHRLLDAGLNADLRDGECGVGVVEPDGGLDELLLFGKGVGIGNRTGSGLEGTLCAA